MKFNLILFIFVLLSNYLECSLFNPNPCKGYEASPMDNLNYTKLLGNWYYYASSSNYDNLGGECLKKNYLNHDKNNIFYEESLLSSNDTIVKTNETRQIDSETPGIIKRSKQMRLIGIFGNTYSQMVSIDSVIVYTDYSNIQLRYSCTNLDHFWLGDKYQYYFVLVRDRNFDSIKLMKPLLIKLKRLGLSLDDMVLFNNQKCTN